MSDTPIKFKYGELENLDAIEPSTSTDGTVYVAKTTNNRAYMYADFGGVRYDITSPNRVYYGTSEDESQTVKTATAENFILEPGATVTILFTTPLQLNNATLNVNSTGNVAIVYRGSAASKKSLPANSVYTFIYINSQFHLIGDLDQVNNGIAIRTSQFPDSGTPILIAAKEVSEDTKSVTAVTNITTPITANVNYGTITAPNGFYTHGINDNYGNEQVINYTNQGIYYEDNDNYQGFDIYFNPSQIKIFDHYNGMKFLQMDTSGGETYLNGNIVANGNIESYNNLYGYNVYSQGYRLPRVYSGTTEPSASLGEDGDIYIMYS